MKLEVKKLGLVDYAGCYELQRELVRQRQSNAVKDTLLFVEHPEVVTYGRKSKVEEQAINSIFVERGGEATLHNPGQLVIYPILKLVEHDLHLYLRRLEEVLIRTLSTYGINSERREGETGVWLVGQMKKIASIGVAVSGWVTYHGSALNVNNDLSAFQKIQPCGYSSSVMTSMQSMLGNACPSMESVTECYEAQFLEVFDLSVRSAEKNTRNTRHSERSEVISPA